MLAKCEISTRSLALEARSAPMTVTRKLRMCFACDWGVSSFLKILSLSRGWRLQAPTQKRTILKWLRLWDLGHHKGLLFRVGSSFAPLATWTTNSTNLALSTNWLLIQWFSGAINQLGLMWWKTDLKRYLSQFGPSRNGRPRNNQIYENQSIRGDYRIKFGPIYPRV